MDLWLLTAGAIVLIGITLWIVWPARTADPVGKSVRGEEVSEQPMTESVTLWSVRHRATGSKTSTPALLPTCRAGGVAAAVEGMHADAAAPPPRQPVPHAGPGRDSARRVILRPGQRRKMGAGVGAVLAVSGGIGGAWLYARWQRERNKPINRLRRNAREMASRLGERIPDVDELPHGAAPMSGAATALLLTALIASRALRRDHVDGVDEIRDRAEELLRASAQETLELGREALLRGRKEATERGAEALKRGRNEGAEATEAGSKEGAEALKRGRKEAAERGAEALKRGRKEAAERGAEALKRGRKEAMKQGREAMELSKREEARKPAIMGIGFGGMAMVAGGAFVVWRLLHRGQPDRSTWYAGE